jgi:signal transduction histidine kinase
VARSKRSPARLVVALAVAALLAIPTVRRRLRPLENALLADVRAQAAAEATEQERARLARELHDVPLQELFGVIRRLEVKPGTEAESDDLRALASHLRNIAIELRPPVLDDLGLPAALEYLAQGATSPERPVLVAITDETGLARGQRPPDEVETAMFRIAMEAVANAVAHSGATQIQLRAQVDPRCVRLSVSDNGTGLDPTAARDALRLKHMGLSSMRRRADAIDADFSINATPAGTTVEALWQS